MKIYLLVLALTIFAHSSFRHLRNLTVPVPIAPLVQSLSSNEVVIQYGETIVVYDINQKKELQNIKQDAAAPVQYVSSSNALIYPNGNDIKQVRSNSKSANKTLIMEKSDWIPDIGVYGSDVVVAKYGQAAKSKIFNIYGTVTNPWNTTNIIWNGPSGDNVKGGSGVSVLSENEFYFAAGGTCDGKQGQIFLQQGSRAGIQNIFNFSFSDCDFAKENKDWSLKSYNFDQVKYHLLTYAPSSDNPRRFTSQLISNQNDKYDEVVHFDVQYQIGAALYSQNVLYTADNLLCRVLQHDITNHDHEHYPKSAFQYAPTRTYITPSEKYVTIITSEFDNYARVIVYQFDAKNQPNIKEIVGPYGNAVRGEVVGDRFLLTSNDAKNKSLSLKDLTAFDQIKQLKTNVVDFCVSNQDIIFIIEQTDNGQTLQAYTLENTTLVSTSDTIDLTYKVQSISCLNNNNVFLDPLEGTDFEIYNLNNKILFKFGSMKKDSKLHASFAYTNEVLIFTNSFNNNSLFYNYKFTQLVFSWNLPENSYFSIIKARQNHVLVAVGDDVEHLASLELYTIQNNILTYQGTYPYFDDGEAAIPNILLLPQRGILHMEYTAISGRTWSTYFDLDAPPLKSIGYFYDTDKTCTDFYDAIFHFTLTSNEVIFLNKNTKPSLERYAIKDSSLQKIESVPLNFQNIGLSLKQSANRKEIIISGINSNVKYAVQIRNINLLSKVIYSNEKQTFAKSLSLQSAEIANQLVVSAFIDKQQGGSVTSQLYFDTNTNNPIAANTDIFTKITLLAACPKCSRIAFTGTLKTPLLGKTTIVIQDYQSPLNPKSFDTYCQINFLALSPSGSAVAYSCLNNTIFVQSTTPLSLPQKYNKITALSFLDDNTLIANLDDKVVTIPINPISLHKPNRKAVAAVNSYAVDYNKQIYAVAISDFSIQIYNSTTGLLVDTIPIKSTDPISSMSFNSNDELVVVSTTGTIIILTQIPCSKDQYTDGYFCICKQLFIQDIDQCTCNYVYDSNNGNCNCDDGYYFSGGNNCDSCSAMCSTCSSGGAFDCDQFGVWFYVIIIGSILVVAGAVLIAVFKLRRREKQETMYTEEKTKLSEPFVSEKQDQIRRDSRNKIDQ